MKQNECKIEDKYSGLTLISVLDFRSVLDILESFCLGVSSAQNLVIQKMG